MQFDAVDASLVVLGVASAFMLVGIATFQLFDVQFSNTLFTVAGYDLSTAWILGYASILATIATNDNTDFNSLSDDVRNLEGYYLVAATGALALPIAYIVFPNSVGSFFSGSDLWGLVYVILVTSGQVAVGWML